MLHFKEDNFIILEFEQYKTYALRGTSDLNKLPTVQIRSVAYKQSSNSNPSFNQGKISKKNSPGHISNTPSDTNDEGASETKIIFTTTSSPKNNQNEEVIEGESTLDAEGKAKVDGTELFQDNLLEGEPSKDETSCSNTEYFFGIPTTSSGLDSTKSVINIFKDGLVYDWELFSKFCRYILKKELRMLIKQNQSPVVLCIPTNWTKFEREMLVKLFFEDFNVPAMIVLDRPLASIYGNGATHGLTIDISYDVTTIIPIFDSQIQHNAIRTAKVGGSDIAKCLLELIKSQNKSLCDEISLVGNVYDFCLLAVESGHCEFKLDERLFEKDSSNNKSNPTVVEFNDKKFELGDERFKCCEMSFGQSGSDLDSGSGSNKSPVLMEAIKNSLMSIDPQKRLSLLSNFPVVMEVLLSRYILSQSEHFSEFQSRECKVCKIPEYFHGWQKSHHMATSLGSSIIGKISLNDPKFRITKLDYNELGPSVVHTKTYS
ncbi:hypothetical protein BB560_000812 [Smittium megazygosporum]|uniref:Uncharacterized protein n=1 Tax=Smittium megazygosporum TaxID=133381 RepID=A0A2T9ZJ85_9FUNG|nr:hypothetical protein BB560_000812 [Smittium megazygosporum]